MRGRSLLALAVACFMVGAAPSAQQTNALQAASDAIGAANVKSLRVQGWGAMFTLHRSFTPNEPWPRVHLKSYTASIDYDTASMRVELVRESGLVMPLGGGGPFVGEQRPIQVVSGTFAWNEQPPASPGGPPRAQPQLGAVADRMLTLWATPHGFVKAAMANNASTRSVPGGTEVTFAAGGKYKMVGLLNAKNQVERVRTWIPDHMLGDMLVETVYQVYREFDGVVFPSRIMQSQGGFPTLDIQIASVQANVPVAVTVPENVRNAKPESISVKTEQLANGVHYITGGPVGTVAVEMRDHIVMIEAGEDEEWVHAYVAKTKELIPNKPIRYVIVSHQHADHNGGVRAYIDLGATIVTHEVHKPFFERVAKAPFTLEPDSLSKSKRAAKFLTYPQTRRLTDGTRHIDLYENAENIHGGGMLISYLLNEKILTEADAPGTAPSGPLNIAQVPSVAATLRLIRNEKLDVTIVVPFHGGRTTTVAELEKSLVKIPSTN
jgi:glyoxylase-like metal-dependent hydrolase (beta-lactamase superfamily II)